MPHRCFVDATDWPETALTLEREEAHHLMHVLRVQPGDAVELFDGCGRTMPARVVDRSRAKLFLERDGDDVQHPPDRPHIHLIQCLIKTHRLEWLLQKAAELGATRITLCASDHSVVPADEWRRPNKRARLERILVEATRQSGRAWMPQLQLAGSLTELVEQPLGGPFLFGDIDPATPPLRAGLRAIEEDRVVVAIGPEGDFSQNERTACRAVGGMPFGLGPHVLRSETAAMAVLAAVHYEFLGRSTPRTVR